MTLVDQFSRKINYLRVSVTDRCDLRCVYCMKEKMTFLPKSEILTLEEIERLCDNFIELGVSKIRITGGEPLVRRDIIELIKKLNFKKNKTNLKEITRFGNLDNVIKGIKEAIKNKIKVKINVVALKNFNENELEKLIFWANKLKIDITFIEVMPMEETGIDRYHQFISLDQTFNKLNSIFEFKKIDKNTGGPALYYQSKKLSINVGFITPLSNNFCSSCNRIRITSTGKLFMCLGQNEYIDFRNILRKDYGDDYIKEKINYALKIKPKRHDFLIEENNKPYIQRHMNVTGG